GLLEHTLSVTRLASYIADHYPAVNRDLLITAAILHDIGKTKELSYFPTNDYTDSGQMLGHIMIGAEMIHDHASKIEGFPELLETELKHCILAHHGEFEFGSPKKPAIIEAMALNLADNLDAKLETMTEILENGQSLSEDWLGFNRFFDSNLRRT
ncbi:MAG: HD domain-containing protein, partial [Lachnospiraceae bacterium]|nr:HD domain-containing protein [Lachnospiraceae bacterium]